MAYKKIVEAENLQRTAGKAFKNFTRLLTNNIFKTHNKLYFYHSKFETNKWGKSLQLPTKKVV